METPADLSTETSKERCSVEEFGEYMCNKAKENDPNHWCTCSSTVDHYEKRFCTNHGGIEIMPYMLNGECSAFDCLCSSENYLKDVMSESYYCEDINIRSLGFCSKKEFLEDTKNDGWPEDRINKYSNFQCPEENQEVYFWVDGNKRICIYADCLTDEQYHQAKKNLEYLF